MKQQDTTDMKKKCQDDITSTTTPNSPSTTSTETISNTETTTTLSFSTEIVQKNTTVTTSAFPTSTEAVSNMENTSFTILNNNTVTQSNEYENATRDNGDNSSSDSPNHTYPYTSTTIETPTTTILTLSSSTTQESLNNSYPFTTIIYNQTTDLVNTVYSPGVNNSDTGSVTNSNEVEGTTLAFNRTADMNDGAGNTNDEALTTVSVHGSEQKTGKQDDNPKGGSIATNHGGSDSKYIGYHPFKKWRLHVHYQWFTIPYVRLALRISRQGIKYDLCCYSTSSNLGDLLYTDNIYFDEMDNNLNSSDHFFFFWN